MNRPTLTASGGAYLLEFAEEQITVRIDRLLENSHFEVSGEMSIRSATPEAAKHIHQARLNMTSTTARRTLAKALMELWPLGGWDDAIEYSCVLVLEAFRQGEPAKKVMDIPKREAIRYRIRPYVLEGKANLMFGPGGIAKSFMAQWWSVLVDSYTLEANGTRTECEPGVVLYLDYETDEDDFRDRIAALHEGLGIKEVDSTILYRFCHQPLPNDMAAIERICAEHKVDYLVVDSAGPACGGDLENAQAVLRYFSALRALKITTLTIGHTQKNADAKTPLGSAYWINMPRNIWQARGTEPGDHESVIVLSHFKANSLEKHQPAAYRLRFGAGVVIEATQPNLIPEAVEAMGLRQRMALAMKDGGKTVVELATGLQAKEDVVRTTLNRYRDKNFVKIDGLRWGNLASENGHRNSVI